MMDLKINELQPSQIYLSKEKIARVKSWFKHKQDLKDPIIVRHFPSYKGYVIVDGHTRAFVAQKLGHETILCVYDQDEYDSVLCEFYERALLWCRDRKISCISDLSQRILPSDLYQIKWIDRCQSELKKLSESDMKD